MFTELLLPRSLWRGSHWQPDHLPGFKLPNSSAGSETRTTLAESFFHHPRNRLKEPGGRGPPATLLIRTQWAQRHSSHFPGDSPQALLLSASSQLLPEPGDWGKDAQARRNKIPYRDVAQGLLTLRTSLLLVGPPKFRPVLFTLPRSGLSATLPDHTRVTLGEQRLKKQSHFGQIHTSPQSLLTCPRL